MVGVRTAFDAIARGGAEAYLGVLARLLSLLVERTSPHATLGCSLLGALLSFG